jgi:ABC-2 type transport system permease protein
MNSLILALKAEIEKNKHSKISLISFIAFAIVPVMGGIFMLVMQNPQAMVKATLLNTKMQAMNISASWDALFMILTQGVGIGGIMVFGFIASWIFGREYSDNTVKDLLSLPTSRLTVLNAKYIVYFLWSIALATANVALGSVIGLLLQLPDFDAGNTVICLQNYFFTTLLTLLTGTPIAFFSMWGKGYLSPLGFVALMLVFSQLLAALGYGQYFPWSVPALYSGAGGDYKMLLNEWSYLILIMVAVSGYCVAALYWKYADYSK